LGAGLRGRHFRGAKGDYKGDYEGDYKGADAMDEANRNETAESADRAAGNNVPWPDFTRDILWDRIAWVCVFVGVLVILGGCFVATAMKNSGGIPVSLDEERRANLVFIVCCGVGAAVGIGGPMAVVLRRRCSPH
jgi:ABC-type Fe3+ transport system permease subunit